MVVYQSSAMLRPNLLAVVSRRTGSIMDVYGPHLSSTANRMAQRLLVGYVHWRTGGGDGLSLVKPFGRPSVLVADPNASACLPTEYVRLIVSEHDHASIADAMTVYNHSRQSMAFVVGGMPVYRECLRSAISPVLYVLCANRVDDNMGPPDSSSLFDEIDDTIYDLVADIDVSDYNNNDTDDDDDDRLNLMVYTWTSEFCQTLVHDAKRKINLNKH